MFKTDNYKNKTVVITGGTKGIGLGITKAYLSLSAKVIILARNKPKKQIKVKGNKALSTDHKSVDTKISLPEGS